MGRMTREAEHIDAVLNEKQVEFLEELLESRLKDIEYIKSRLNRKD